MDKLTFTSFGAAEEVTGSKHILEYKGTKILLDCGMFQGQRYESKVKNNNLGFEPDSIDAVILSHAHIDHCGLLPLLTKRGFTGKIYCTPPTGDLLGIMLKDSAHIQEADERYYAKHPELYTPFEKDPLYTEEDVEKCLQYVEIIPCHNEFSVGNFKIKFYGAGHVLGSVLTLITAGKKKILFSGDLGRENMPLLIDREKGIEADVVVMESTYGGRFHDPVDLSSKSLEEIIKSTISKGGKVIIPSFALERTQEILYFLEESFKQKRLPNIPIYVDSPMAIAVTEVFQKHKETYDTEMKARYKDWTPFSSRNIHFTETTEESKQINAEKMPSIIISASGMCEAGRIRHHLKNSIDNYKNTILIVGYMAEGTLGRKLIENKKVVSIFGQNYMVKANVQKLNSFSGHADETDLLSWLKSIKKKKKVILVHGEEKSLEALKEKIDKMVKDVVISKRTIPIEI